jgi:thioredoxin 1
MANVELVNGENFKEMVSDSRGVVLLDFFANWCSHCQKLLPLLDEVATDLEGKARILKVNVDENRDLAQKFQIKGLPTMVLFKDGNEIDRLIGYMPKEKITEKLVAQN